MKLIKFFASTAALNAGAVLSSASLNTTTQAPVPDAVGTTEEPDEIVATSEVPTGGALITMTTPGPFFVAPTRCTAEERAVWIGNQEFSAAYKQAASRAWGDSVDTVTYLDPPFPGISRYCLSCLGEATGCAREHCWAQCILDQSSEACSTCINDNCIPDMLTCTGAANASELPLPPQPAPAPASPSTRVRPSKIPNIQIPTGSANSGSEHSPAVSGPGRLRAPSVDADWGDALLEAPEGSNRFAEFNDLNVMTVGIVMAFVAAIVALAMRALS